MPKIVKNYAIVVFIDIKKAFDTVDHGIHQKVELLWCAWNSK